jgi:hypothetical protein
MTLRTILSFNRGKKEQVMETEATATTATEATATEPVKAKSIVDPKYRNKYKDKNRHEWLADLLKVNASAFHTIPAKPAVGKEGEEGYKPATAERRVIDGVDVDKVFKIARENGLDVDKYEAQRDTHGFPGRFRMTAGNMLRTVARQRHGLFINGEWQEAPADWLTAQGVEGGPTHNKDGSKIAVAKAAEPAAESKLIKAAPATDGKAETGGETPAGDTATTAKGGKQKTKK